MGAWEIMLIFFLTICIGLLVIVSVKYVIDDCFYKKANKLIEEKSELEAEKARLECENAHLIFQNAGEVLASQKAFWDELEENQKLRAELSKIRCENETLKLELSEAKKSARKAWRAFYGVKK